MEHIDWSKKKEVTLENSKIDLTWVSLTLFYSNCLGFRDKKQISQKTA